MISQDLVDTAIEQFSNDLPWSFVLQVDILSKANWFLSALKE